MLHILYRSAAFLQHRVPDGPQRRRHFTARGSRLSRFWFSGLPRISRFAVVEADHQSLPFRDYLAIPRRSNRVSVHVSLRLSFSSSSLSRPPTCPDPSHHQVKENMWAHNTCQRLQNGYLKTLNFTFPPLGSNKWNVETKIFALITWSLFQLVWLVALVNNIHRALAFNHDSGNSCYVSCSHRIREAYKQDPMPFLVVMGNVCAVSQPPILWPKNQCAYSFHSQIFRKLWG